MITAREELQSFIDSLIGEQTKIKKVFLFSASNALMLLSSQIEIEQDVVKPEVIAAWLTRSNLPVLSNIGFGDIQSSTFKFLENTLHLCFIKPLEESLILLFVCDSSVVLSTIEQKYLPVFRKKFESLATT